MPIEGFQPSSIGGVRGDELMEASAVVAEQDMPVRSVMQLEGIFERRVVSGSGADF